MKIISPIAKAIVDVLPSFVYLPIPFGRMKGIKWICKSANPGQILGRYESAQSEILVGLLSSSNVFWDVGAHAGWYSLLASKIMPHGSIVSFEPNPNNLNFVTRHLAINSINNVELKPIALSDRIGNFGFSGDAQFGQLDSQGKVMVEVTTTDKLLAENSHLTPDLIKLDIEGAEIAFLKGAVVTIKRSRPKILLSAHGYEKRDWCVSFLETLGYRIKMLVTDKHAGDYVFLAEYSESN